MTLQEATECDIADTRDCAIIPACFGGGCDCVEVALELNLVRPLRRLVSQRLGENIIDSSTRREIPQSHRAIR